MAFARFMVFVMFVQAFWYGSSLVESGSLSAGGVLRTLWACLIAMESIQEILPQIFVLDKGKFAGASLKAVLHSHPANIVSKKPNIRPLFCKGEIKVNRVRANIADI
jgi:ATP-binding cassette, subfamily B (MDR/TAP), member 1